MLANEASLIHDRCEQFVTSVKLQNLLNPKSPTGYIPMLKHIQDVSQALLTCFCCFIIVNHNVYDILQAVSEVQEYVLDSFQSQLVNTLHKRNRDMSSEEVITFVRRCVRRQVEAAIYLPLRRNVIKLTFPFLSAETAELQRAMAALRDASPLLFLAHPMVRQAKSFEAARRMFRDISRAYLPADQGQLLIRAAGTVLAVYSECRAMTGAQEKPVSKKPVVARPDLLKSLISPSSSDAVNDSTSDVKRSVSVPARSESHAQAELSQTRTMSLADTPAASIRSPKKAIFVVPRQPPEKAESVANTSPRQIDYSHEDVKLDPVAALFPSLDTEENLDGKFMRLAEGARVTDLADSSLPACMHSPDSKNGGKSADPFSNSEATETAAADMREFMSPRLDDISILTARGPGAQDGGSGTGASVRPQSLRVAQLQKLNPEDQDDTPTRGLQSILSDLSVRFNSVRMTTEVGESTANENYGIDTNVESDGEEDEEDNAENGSRTNSYSETWKTAVCVTPGLPSPKSTAVSPDGSAVSGVLSGTRQSGPSPQKAPHTQAQSQALALSRPSTESAKGRAHLFDMDSPTVSHY